LALARQRKKAVGKARPGGFDFTLHVRRLCADITSRLPELNHVEMSRVAVSFSQTRKTSSYGMYASLTAMRFPEGRTHTIRRGRKWGVQQLIGPGGKEMLYILTFYLPRFLDMSFEDKLLTVFHELWHINPKFNGDSRRYAGRCHAHGSSQAKYEARVSMLVERWQSLDPPSSIQEFLKHDFATLVSQHGRVFGQKITAPKLIAVG
jgi:predicted metallopeptidase